MSQTLGMDRRRVICGGEQRACGYGSANKPGAWTCRQVHRAPTLRKAPSTVSEGQQSMGMRLAFW